MLTKRFEDVALGPVRELRRTCRDCGAEFRISAGELRFLARVGARIFTRCPSCRDARRWAGATDRPDDDTR